MELLSLVGEQPIPILLPARYLAPTKNLLLQTKRTACVADRLGKLLLNAQSVPLAALPYDLNAVLKEIRELFQKCKEVVVNLTGGTKIMALAAFAIASEYQRPVCYFQSEGHKSVLYLYQHREGKIELDQKAILPELITAEDYLSAHLTQFQSTGPSEFNGKITPGGVMEEAVSCVLKEAGFEVLVGVRPLGAAHDIDVDLVIRKANQIGIAELKTSGGKGIKKGIDQLTNAGGREYLGTYTTRFLIVGGKLDEHVRKLAGERQVQTIELPSYRNGSLSPEDQTHLIQRINRGLIE